VDHKDFYNLGRKIDLLEGNPSEAELRTSIGRIYYYVYHEILRWVNCETLLLNAYYESEILSTHKRLIDTFAKVSKNTQKLIYGKICRLIGALHTLRCNADYQLHQKIDMQTYKSTLANFEDLKEACEQLRPDMFQIDINTISETLGTTQTTNAEIKVKKRTIRILD